MTMIYSKLTNIGTLELTQKLSERIKNQQKTLVQSQQQVDVLRQEHQQLKRRVEHNRSQILTDN
jgi:cell division protein FtsB